MTKAELEQEVRELKAQIAVLQNTIVQLSQRDVYVPYNPYPAPTLPSSPQWASNGVESLPESLRAIFGEYCDTTDTRRVN